MGREVKRVPLDFDWPIGKIWPGYMFSLCTEMEYIEKDNEKRCELCRHYAKIMNYEITKHNCPLLSFRDPPRGEGYQLWETISEGSPMSPVFDTPEKLAKWLTNNKASASGDMTCDYDTWLKFIKGPGWAPTGMTKGNKFYDGITASIDKNYPQTSPGEDPVSETD